MLAEIFGLDGIVVVIIVLVVLFGGAAIPKLARSLGSAQGEFKKGLAESKAGEKTDPEASAAAGGADASANGTNPASAPANAEETDQGRST